MVNLVEGFNGQTSLESSEKVASGIVIHLTTIQLSLKSVDQIMLCGT
jgi:hypothetical protein